MASSPTQTVLAALQHDISIAKAQFEKLDENDEEYEVKRMVLQHGVESLEEQKEAAERRQHNSPLEDDELPSLPIVGDQRPQTSDSVRSSVGFGSYAGNSPRSFGGRLISDNIAQKQDRPIQWSFDNLEHSPTTPDNAVFPAVTGNFASGSGSTSSPDSGFVRPQKRQRESFDVPADDSAGRASKSIRTTPSPAMTAPTTPSSNGSWDFPDDPDLIALLGGNPAQDMRDMREDQKEQEKALKARRQQELADEEYARQLEEQERNSAQSGSYSMPEPSATFRGTSQTVFDSQGRVRRPTPYAFSSSPGVVKEEDSLPASLPVEQGNSYPDGYSMIKNEGSYRPIQRNPDASNDFIDLESEEYNKYHPNLFNSHSSSDPVEIDSTIYGGDNQTAEPPVLSAPRGYNPYENVGTAGPSSWANSGGLLGQSLVDSASSLFNGVYNGAYNLLDRQLEPYGNTPSGFGGTSVYGSNSNVIDLDSYESQPYLPQDVFSRHGINAHDPVNRDLVASYMDRIDYVTNDPTRTAEEIKCLLENIRPDEELPAENREGTPEAMTYPLMEHQKLGLTWMKSMEEGSNKGGILADAMGLGKTIQALALMVARKSTDRLCKTTLIVCPVALLKQWESEISTKLKASHALKVYTLHNEKRHIGWSTLRTNDVVLTTFGTLGTEVKRRSQIE